MMTTGWPEANLAATCGSVPTGCAPPFGGRQGTRLKMSLADFAACLTLSTARSVRLLLGLTAACAVGCTCAGVAPFAAVVAALPTVSEAAACADGVACALCAWAAGASTSSADTASAMVAGKGRRRPAPEIEIRIKPKVLILLRRSEMRRVEDEIRQRAADAVMHALCKLGAMHGAEKIEIPLLIPLTHDGESIEQRNIVLLRNCADVVHIGRAGNHGLGARAILQVHQDHIGSRILQRGNTAVDRGMKIVGIRRSHSIHRAGLPDDQSRLFVFHKLNKACGPLFRGLLGL